MSTHFNKLTPEQLEALAVLSEELGEVQQAVGKILRHGLLSVDPTLPADKQVSNMISLATELGDVFCAVDILHEARILNREFVQGSSERKKEKIGKYLHHTQAPKPKVEKSNFDGMFVSGGKVAHDITINIFKSQISTKLDLEAWRLNSSFPFVTREGLFPVGKQTVPVLVVEDQQQLKSDLAIIRFACQEEGYGLDAVHRLEKILTEPNATSQIVWAKKEEIERAKQLGGSFNVWITRYSDLDTAMLLPPQEMVQKRSSLERTQKKKIDFPPPM